MQRIGAKTLTKWQALRTPLALLWRIVHVLRAEDAGRD